MEDQPRLGRGMARFNRAVTNHVSVHLAGHAPLFALVLHTGRRSGELYRTPVNAFEREGGGFRVALTYGRDAEWVKNVMAAGEARLVHRGHELRLVAPEIVHDPERRGVPWPMRAVLRVLRVSDFLELHEASEVR